MLWRLLNFYHISYNKVQTREYNCIFWSFCVFTCISLGLQVSSNLETRYRYHLRIILMQVRSAIMGRNCRVVFFQTVFTTHFLSTILALTSEWNPLECSHHQLATVFDAAGESDHREVFSGPGAIKLKRSQDWGDMKLCFSASLNGI